LRLYFLIGFRLAVVAAGSGDRSFLIAIAPETFLRKAPLTFTVSDSAWLWQMLIYLGANSSLSGHSIQRLVLADRSRRIYGVSRVAQTGGISIRQLRIGSNNRC